MYCNFAVCDIGRPQERRILTFSFFISHIHCSRHLDTLTLRHRMAKFLLVCATLVASSVAHASVRRVQQPDAAPQAVQDFPIFQLEMMSQEEVANITRARRLQTNPAGTVLTVGGAMTGELQAGTNGGTLTFSWQMVDSTLPLTFTLQDKKTGALFVYSGNKYLVRIGATSAVAAYSEGTFSVGGAAHALWCRRLLQGCTCWLTTPSYCVYTPSEPCSALVPARRRVACPTAAPTTSSQGATWPQCTQRSRTRASGRVRRTTT